ncbi:hypothetical protein ABIF62_003159 [Bradyrhizobium japonicum]
MAATAAFGADPFRDPTMIAQRLFWPLVEGRLARPPAPPNWRKPEVAANSAAVRRLLSQVGNRQIQILLHPAISAEALRPAHVTKAL